MSKQLAISAAASVFAMAAMVLAYTPDNSGSFAHGTYTQMQAGITLPDLPSLPFPGR